jgi:hypothetical protein
MSGKLLSFISYLCALAVLSFPLTLNAEPGSGGSSSLPDLKSMTTVSIIDSSSYVGYYTSVTIGQDGFPVISYYDYKNGYLKVAKCADASCTPASVTKNVIDSTGSLGGLRTSIATGKDGFPVISYTGGFPVSSNYVSRSRDEYLRVAKCADASCTPASVTKNIIDSTGHFGEYTSIIIGKDGFPVISYTEGFPVDSDYAFKNRYLKVARCGDATCTPASVTTNLIDSTEPVSEYTSIAIGKDGFPVISYTDAFPIVSNHDKKNRFLKVARCADASCTPASVTKNTIDSAEHAGEFSSIAIGKDGFPVISYWDISKKGLKVAKCGDASCTPASVTKNIIDTTEQISDHTSIAIGQDGFPVISYYDYKNRYLKVARCADASCTPASVTKNIIDSAGHAGWYASITIGTDGFPVISYWDMTDQILKVARCGNKYCWDPPKR